MTNAFSITGGTMRWIMDDSIHAGIGLSLAEMTVEPGMTSELHRHDNCGEVLYLQNGQIRQRIGDDWHELFAGEKCVIPAGFAHQTRNIGNVTAKMILVYQAGTRNYEAL